MRLRSYRPPLPFELIAYIIDYLDCPVTFKNCSRVCHAWLPLSRSHIFRVVEIVLNGQGVSKRFKRLNTFIERSPYISTYVLELCLTWKANFTPSLPSQYLKLSAVLPFLLCKLTNLRKIALSDIDWTVMTAPEIRSAARALVGRPSLVHVRIHSSQFAKLDDLITLLPPSLKRLDISRNWSLNGAENIGVIDKENKRSPPRKPCQLEYLKCDVTPIIEDLLLNSPSIDISNVHTLDVFSRYGEPESISRIVRRLGSSLEHLDITYSFSVFSYGTVDVSHNPNIKSISFLGPFQAEALPFFKALMSSLMATNIEQITFICQFYLEPEPSGIWEELDSILQGDQFTMLQAVELAVLFVTGNEPKLDMLRRRLSICLPSLHDRGILRISPFQNG